MLGKVSMPASVYGGQPTTLLMEADPRPIDIVPMIVGSGKTKSAPRKRQSELS